MKKVPPRLAEMIEEGVIDDVRSRLLSGKEASVFVVEREGELFAAKVYKERSERSFKNVSSYVEGRNQTRNSRNKRAMSRKTRYGQKLIESDWRETEHNALQSAWHAGVRVPEPYLLYEEVLIMELVCDEHGDPAPRLADFKLDREVAGLLHLEAFLQVRRLLEAEMIHGDLSAFNILVAADGLTLIDMPQIVSASANSEAAELLHRDLKNVTEHFAKFDPKLLRFRDCGSALWNRYKAGTIGQVSEPEVGREHKRGRRLRQNQPDGREGREKQGRDPQGRDKRPPKKKKPRSPEVERVQRPAAKQKPQPRKDKPPADKPADKPEGEATKPRRRRRRRPKKKPGPGA